VLLLWQSVAGYLTPPPINLTQELLDIAQQARSSPRLQQNYNLHDVSEKVQRFINILQPTRNTSIAPTSLRTGKGADGFEFFLVSKIELE